ncbi:MAG: M14 family zinc carboxypeptidase [Candidatus Thorarchaeota archaeon]
MVLAPIQVMATETPESAPTIEKVTTPSVTKTWSTLSLIYDNQFHDPAELDEELENIHTSVPELVDLEVIGQSYEQRNLTCLRITNEQNTVPKAKTLVVAQHHGREQITVELALRFILHLLNNYGDDPLITEYVDTQEIFVIPTLNPDALEIVVNQGNHWLRKNLKLYDNDGDGFFSEDDVEDVDGDGWITNYLVYEKDYPSEVPHINDYDWEYWEGIDNDGDGLVNEDEVGLVDLNRNYATFWGLNDPDLQNPITQIYCGTEAFSENETRAFRDFSLNHRFAMAYSLHSGINATYFPTDENEDWTNGVLYYQIYSDLQDILPNSFNNYLGYSSEMSQEAGLSGGWAEWMYYEQGTTVPITLEVYHNGSVDTEEAHVITTNNNTHIIREWEGIYGYFNPDESHINTLWDELLPVFDYLLEMTPRLDITVTGVSGGFAAGATVDMSVQMECLSPRLGSRGGAYVLGPDGSDLDTLIAIEAGQTLIDQASITLPSDLSTDMSIFIGNNYTGYTEFVLSAGAANGFPFDPLLIGGVVGVSIVAVVLVVYFARYR